MRFGSTPNMAEGVASATAAASSHKKRHGVVCSEAHPIKAAEDALVDRRIFRLLTIAASGRPSRLSSSRPVADKPRLTRLLRAEKSVAGS